MENMEQEAKIARILITISVIFGLFAVVTLLAIGIGSLAGRTGIPGIFPVGALLLAAVKTARTGFGLAAYRTIARGDLRKAGRYALIASLLSTSRPDRALPAQGGQGGDGQRRERR